MQQQGDFISSLGDLLNRKREYLDSKELPALKETYRVFQGSFQGLCEVLLRKSLIEEDPYKFDKKISEVSIPPSTPFMETSISDTIGVRLSDYESQIDFLVSYCHFAVDYLDLERIKNLIGLTRFINWDNLSVTSPDPNTQALAELFGKLKRDADPLSSDILANSQRQLVRLTGEALAILKDLTKYHREQYKYELRTRVMDKIDEDVRDKEETIRLIKKAFTEQMKGYPYYGELVEEILEEDHSDTDGSMRRTLLTELGVPSGETEQNEPVDFKDILLEGIRILASAALHLEQAASKLDANNERIESARHGFAATIRSWFSIVIGRKDKRIFYEVKVEDSSSGGAGIEKIDFEDFLSRTYKQVRILTALSHKISAVYKKLLSAPEERVFTVFDKILTETRMINRLLPALEGRMKETAAEDTRKLLKGIRLEQNALKNCIVKANLKKHEYLSRKEEQSQMKNLGMS